MTKGARRLNRLDTSLGKVGAIGCPFIDTPIGSFVTTLMATTSFEAVATETLRRMLACAEPALVAIPGGPRGRLLRALIHLRPEGSYQHLFGLEHPSGARVEGTGYLTSAVVWKWIVEHACSVSIDVGLGTLRPFIANAGTQRLEAERDTLPGQKTRERMLSRQVTHVHVVPLRLPGNNVLGMITLEADHRAAIGAEDVWGDWVWQLELLASVATPYLMALPTRRKETVHTDELMPVIGPSSERLMELARIFAQQEETILINGRTGVGKSRLARWCHEQSRRKGQPFETLDLLSVPEELQAAELFGWKRGAFTGAVKDTIGAIGRAGQGTLFIDEIDKLSLKAQVSLLRVVETRQYRPIGDESSDRRAHVRFIAGTNADLRALAQTGRFREDLYYRINVLPLRLPALCDRLDELPAWVEYMLARHHQETGNLWRVRISPEAIDLLAASPWPGNLRQLDNLVRRAYTMALPDWVVAGGGDLGDRMLQRHHVERALSHESCEAGSAPTVELWRAARAFVLEAERRREAGKTLSLDLVDSIRGMALGLAVKRCASREDAFTLLGQQAATKNRNHHRMLRRELERVRELLADLGGTHDPELAEMLTGAEDSPDGR